MLSLKCAFQGFLNNYFAEYALMIAINAEFKICSQPSIESIFLKIYVPKN